MDKPAASRWFEHRTLVRAARVSMALLLIVVSWLAFRVGPPPEPSTGWDKLDHLVAFATLALNAVLAWRLNRAARITFALLFYGALIEAVQTLIPGRSGELTDVLADAVGIGIGLALAAVLFQVKKTLRR